MNEFKENRSDLTFQDKPGFTLVELLVVLAVIGILLSLLLTGISRSREQAARVQCANNSKQILIAWTLYSHDFNDALAPNVDGRYGGFTNWVAGNMTFASDANDLDLLADKNRSLLSAYVRAVKVYKCPSDESPFVRSVSMNCRVNPIRDPDEGKPRWISGNPDQYRVFRKSADVFLNDRILVILDENSTLINDPYFAIDMSNTGQPDGLGNTSPYYLIDFPGSHHLQGATISFADGHTSLQKWFEESTIHPQVAPLHVSANSKDAAWLQHHSTVFK
jgi:prepilin-type N-terminal cleavage/methylation domain-containing protein/prepilin-type processing-associated H-X9-DG protein